MPGKWEQRAGCATLLVLWVAMAEVGGRHVPGISYPLPGVATSCKPWAPQNPPVAQKENSWVGKLFHLCSGWGGVMGSSTRGPIDLLLYGTGLAGTLSSHSDHLLALRPVPLVLATEQ